MLTVAAMETTLATPTRVFHLLTLHPGVQDKPRNELRDVCCENEELTHDHLVSSPFLQAVCRETVS